MEFILSLLYYLISIWASLWVVMVTLFIVISIPCVGVSFVVYGLYLNRNDILCTVVYYIREAPQPWRSRFEKIVGRYVLAQCQIRPAVPPQVDGEDEEVHPRPFPGGVPVGPIQNQPHNVHEPNFAPEAAIIGPDLVQPAAYIPPGFVAADIPEHVRLVAPILGVSLTGHTILVLIALISPSFVIPLGVFLTLKVRKYLRRKSDIPESVELVEDISRSVFQSFRIATAFSGLAAFAFAAAHVSAIKAMVVEIYNFLAIPYMDEAEMVRVMSSLSKNDDESVQVIASALEDLGYEPEDDTYVMRAVLFFVAAYAIARSKIQKKFQRKSDRLVFAVAVSLIVSVCVLVWWVRRSRRDYIQPVQSHMPVEVKPAPVEAPLSSVAGIGHADRVDVDKRVSFVQGETFHPTNPNTDDKKVPGTSDFGQLCSDLKEKGEAKDDVNPGEKWDDLAKKSLQLAQGALEKEANKTEKPIASSAVLDVGVKAAIYAAELHTYNQLLDDLGQKEKDPAIIGNNIPFYRALGCTTKQAVATVDFVSRRDLVQANNLLRSVCVQKQLQRDIIAESNRMAQGILNQSSLKDIPETGEVKILPSFDVSALNTYLQQHSIKNVLTDKQKYDICRSSSQEQFEKKIKRYVAESQHKEKQQPRPEAADWKDIVNQKDSRARVRRERSAGKKAPKVLQHVAREENDPDRIPKQQLDLYYTELRDILSNASSKEDFFKYIRSHEDSVRSDVLGKIKRNPLDIRGLALAITEKEMRGHKMMTFEQAISVVKTKEDNMFLEQNKDKKGKVFYWRTYGEDMWDSEERRRALLEQQMKREHEKAPKLHDLRVNNPLKWGENPAEEEMNFEEEVFDDEAVKPVLSTSTIKISEKRDPLKDKYNDTLRGTGAKVVSVIARSAQSVDCPESVLLKSAFLSEKRVKQSGGVISCLVGGQHQNLANAYKFGNYFVVPHHAVVEAREAGGEIYFRGEKLRFQCESGFQDLDCFYTPSGVRQLSNFTPFGSGGRKLALLAYSKAHDWTFTISVDNATTFASNGLTAYGASSEPGHSGGLVCDVVTGECVGIHLLGGRSGNPNKFLPFTGDMLKTFCSVSKN